MTIITWTAQDDEMTPDDVPLIMVEEAHMVGQEEVTVGMVVAGAMAFVTDGMTIIMTEVAEVVVSNVDPQGFRSSAIATMDATMAPPPSPAPVIPTVVEQRPKRKKLEVEDFAGTAGENVVSWLEAVKQAQQMQMVTPSEMKNAAYLEWHLRDTYGSRESAWDVQLRLVQRRQQPGELLQDYANSLTELGTGHPGLTSFLYVDAFARGLNNKISAQAVRTAKPLTLEQAVSFSIENCGKYGEGAEVNNWELAAQMREKNRGNEAHHASVATTAEPADQLDWTKLGLNIGASGDKPPRYDPEGRPLEEITTVRGLGKSGFFPLAALQAIEAATRATVGEQKATRVSVTPGKQKVAKAMEIKWEEKKEPPAALVSEHAAMAEEDVALVGVEHQEITKAEDQVDEVHDSEATGGKDGTLGKHLGRMLLSGVPERSNPREERKQTGAESITEKKPTYDHDRNDAVDGFAYQEEISFKKSLMTKNATDERQNKRMKGSESMQSASAHMDATNVCEALTPVYRGEAVVQPGFPQGPSRAHWRVIGGVTVAARRQQRRSESDMATVQGIVTRDLRERQEEKAQALRRIMRKRIVELREVQDIHTTRQRQIELQKVMAKVHKVAAMMVLGGTSKEVHATTGAVRVHVDSIRNVTAAVVAKDDGVALEDVQMVMRVPAAARLPDSVGQQRRDMSLQWAKNLKKYEDQIPTYLEEAGSLDEMRAVRRLAKKEVKAFRAALRRRRLQNRQELQQRVKNAIATERAAWVQLRQHRHELNYEYHRRGGYKDAGVVSEEGKQLRVAQLRIVGNDTPSSLPAVRLTMSKKHVQEVKLDTCAQFSVVSAGLRQFGRCSTREAPVDLVEGFGGGRVRIIGVWSFHGVTKFQQTVIVDALVVDAPGCEFLVGEDWMVDKQAKINFAKRELKYKDEHGQRIILPFTCYGVTSLSEATRSSAMTVRLAKTVKASTNMCGIVRVKVDASNGSTGVFLPKLTHKRYLLLAPTLSTVQNGEVAVAVLNLEGRREKLPARAELGTWIPTDKTMKILSLNGELDREHVAQWVIRPYANLL
ncbi:hypothetical protein PInf_021519 [Phytophthora infestans]|nr:hypothetical protein PInf_021519 [Phytophthora infestans]